MGNAQSIYTEQLSNQFQSVNLDQTPQVNTYTPYYVTNNPEPMVYNMYAAPQPSDRSHVPQKMGRIKSFFTPEGMRQEFQKRNDAKNLEYITSQAIPEGHTKPTQLHQYHRITFLAHGTKLERKSSKIFRVPTWVYKATDELDGNTYVLRRIEGIVLSNEAAMSSVDTWRRIHHPNIVQLKEAFTTKAFNDNSVVFVYAFHPRAETLQAKYFDRHYARTGERGFSSVSDRVLFAFITQMLSAIRQIHSQGLSARVLDPSKVLVTGESRFRLNCCGIFDTIAFDPTKHGAFQQDDLLCLGMIIVKMACQTSLISAENLAAALEFIEKSYKHSGSVVCDLVRYLLNPPTPKKSIFDCFPILSVQFCLQMEHQFRHIDTLEENFCRELENGRLVRLLCKLGFINERPEFEMNPSWSETGDRYLLKLFRDYVFHQVDANMKPVVDMGHVLTCLNKVSLQMFSSKLFFSLVIQRHFFFPKVPC